ncbi:MAG TPA: hypothetical protein VNB29_11430, partial [Chthoniobacterales bacterium]|nr:hypothetical protein [Chthoniobacterales bacterium]
KKNGHTLVNAQGTAYHGQSARLKFKASAAGVPATLSITGSVTSGGRSVPVNNQIKFLGGGRIKGTNLAPGVTTNFAFKGRFAATPTQIDFSGKFKSGSSTNTYKGTIILSGTKLKVAYEIFINGSADASYLYQYSAKR